MSIIEDAAGKLVRILSRPSAPGRPCWGCGKLAQIHLTFDQETLAGQEMDVCDGCYHDLQAAMSTTKFESDGGRRQ